MMKIGMEFWIDYAHHLPGHELCGRPHGHTAQIIVEVKAGDYFIGKIQNNEIANFEDAMAIDFKDLKRDVKEVIDKLDHEDLNKFFAYPSSEVTCNYLFNTLNQLFEERRLMVDLHSVRFYEGHGKYVEIIKDY